MQPYSTSVRLVGVASVLLSLAACLDFDRYGERSAAGGGSTTLDGGAGSAGGPLLGGANGAGGPAEEGGAGGQGGTAVVIECGDGILHPSEICDDALGPPGTCVSCEVVCDDIDEFKDELTSHCYRLDLTDFLSWEEASDACPVWRAGAYLAAIETPAEQTFLKTLFNGTIWLGGNDVRDNQMWVWPTGEPFGFANWDLNAGQPSHNGEDCMGVYQNSEKWHDMTCNDDANYLCEWQPPKR